MLSYECSEVLGNPLLARWDKSDSSSKMSALSMGFFFYYS